MEALRTLLARTELLVLFAVLLAGLGVGRLSYRGFRLGSAGVLFVGLGAGVWVRRWAVRRC
jgi:uncharacterized transporter YbjL